MFAVIFRATIKEIDPQYSEMANMLRELAMNDYGCIDFISCTENGQEVAVSYWPSREHILAWKNNTEHKKAQALGKSKWYQSIQVQIVEVIEDRR